MSEAVQFTTPRLESSLRAEIISAAGAARGRSNVVQGGVRSTRLLMSQAEDDELARWKDNKLWLELARRWRNSDPERRTTEDANAHYAAACKAVGARRRDGRRG